MTITQALADFRIDNWIDILQLPDAVWLRYYNDGRDELIDSIMEEKEDYFYNYITSNQVIWQNEYPLSIRWDLATDWVTVLDGLQKIKSVSAFLNTADANMTKIVPKSTDWLSNDIDSYAKTGAPFYLLQDNSIFIYPTPTTTLTYRIYGIFYPKKLILADIDTLPDQYVKSIMFYIAKRYFTSQKLFNEAQISENKFEADKIKIWRALSWRIQSSVQRTVPNLNYLS